MNTKQQLINALSEALIRLGINQPVSLDRSADPKHGEYTTNVALVVAREKKLQPLVVAHQIIQELNSALSPYVENIEAVNPGFINFWIRKELLSKHIHILITNHNKIAVTDKLREKKVMVEFADPNPFKEFHIGHLFTSIVGESLSRLLESQGAEVKRVCYQGDVGLHVAKALWGMEKKLKMKHQKLKIQEELDLLEKKPLQERAKFMGEAYTFGAQAYEEDQEAKEEIIILNKKIYDKDQSIFPLYLKGRDWSLQYFDIIYKRLGTHFWKFYFESESGIKGLEFVKENLKKGIFEESDGAVVFKGEPYGLHTRVFINKLGLPTYEAKDLGLAATKYADYAYDESIIVTGNEVNAYFTVMLKALSLIDPNLAAKTKHLSHGMVRLHSGKMSSRTGSIIVGEWLLDEAKKRLSQKIEATKKKHDIEEGKERHEIKDQNEQIAEIIGIGAVKYALLRPGIGKDIAFDFEESISFEGNSGPYLQYTYVRTRSVLEKVNTEKVNNLEELFKNNSLADEERILLRSLFFFEEIVAEAAERYSPNILCAYLFGLAQQFNLFYQKFPILNQTVEITTIRLTITETVGLVIHRGLELLGIETPEYM